jgi:exosortase
MSPVLFYVVPFLIAYAGTLVWIVHGWFLPDGYYSHGVLLPALAAFALWRGRASIAAAPVSTSRVGWVVLFAGLALHLVGSALLVDSLSAVSLIPSLVGMLLLTAGTARLRAVGPVVGLLLFAIPLPIFVTGQIAFYMKEAATGTATAIANFFGLGATRVGSLLYVPGEDSPLVVGEPCSGLRSLVALVTLGYCFAFFVGGRSVLRRTVLVLAAVPIALGANLLRIAGLAWLAKWKGVEYASTTGHDIGNWLIYGVAILLLLLIDSRLPDRAADEAAGETEAA